MKYTENEVLEFVEENDVKFIRLAFCDAFGKSKNLAIMASELPRAFDEGIFFSATGVPGICSGGSDDYILCPDSTTLSLLPWRPKQGSVIRFFCNIKNQDGSPIDCDSRYLLSKAIEKAESMGFSCKIGTNCEFYLFEPDENGMPTKIPRDRAGHLDIAPLDRCENVRREICLTLEEMGIPPLSSHHERGPGQNEIDFKRSDALTAADNFITFKSVVKTISAANGVYATFMPKPLSDSSGSGLHINLHLYRDGKNIFEKGSEHTEEAKSFVAGVMNRIREITLFLNPLTNSYERFGCCEAPFYITWSSENRANLIKMITNQGKQSRMEIRSADSTCNPYLAFALVLLAGLEGVEKKLTLAAPSVSPDENTEKLPANLSEAILSAEKSEFVREAIPPKMLSCILENARLMWEKYSAAEDKEAFEEQAYFIYE